MERNWLFSIDQVLAVMYCHDCVQLVLRGTQCGSRYSVLHIVFQSGLL